LSRLERGLANPTLRGILEQIATALEVRVEALFAVPKQDQDRPVPLPGGRRRQ
jgi:hypothetical protein